jgi:hypothetical protein
MSIEISLTPEATNTQYAALAAVLYRYQQQNMLKALDQIEIAMKMRDFSGVSKLIQVMISIMAGCETLSEVNTKLGSEVQLAQLWQWPRFADQSSLSRTLDELSQKNIEQMSQANQQIRQHYGQTSQHDWRKYLWLDFDLSGLPCGPQAEESQKGYFSEKKRNGAPISPRE